MVYRRITRNFLMTLMTALVLFTAFSAVSIWTYAAETEAVKADAAIVLGTKVDGDQPSPALKERINHAIELYENGQVEKIIFTGGRTDGADMAESEVSRNYALVLGVPEEDILIETRSMITEENFLYANKIAEKNGLDSFLVVSDPLHMKRALLMAKVAGIDAHTSPTQTSEYGTLGSQLPFFIRETVCYVGYVLTFAFFN